MYKAHRPGIAACLVMPLFLHFKPNAELTNSNSKDRPMTLHPASQTHSFFHSHSLFCTLFYAMPIMPDYFITKCEARLCADLK